MSALRFAYWKICMIYAIEINFGINALSEHNVQNIFQLFRYKIQFHIISALRLQMNMLYIISIH